MTRFRRSNSSDLRDVADGIVRHLDGVSDRSSHNGTGHDVFDQPRVPAGNGRESGQWTPEGGGATVEGFRRRSDEPRHEF
jgi:hypothetical protein